MAEQLSKMWRQPVVIENRPGAGTGIGAAYVAKARADGYTLLFSSNSYVTNAAVQRNLPFDPVADLQPVVMTAAAQLAIFAGSRIPIASLGEAVAQAKAQKVFVAMTGTGSPGHLIAELFKDKAQINLEFVTYKGFPEALVDLAGGRVDLYIASVTTGLPVLATKKARAIAIASDTRSRLVPDVPTVAESGFPGLEFDVWYGVFVPTGTPADVVAKINASVTAVMSSPEARDFLDKNEALPRTSSPDQFQKIVRDEIAKWKALVTKNNIVAQ